jgi:hypothetical protein
MLTQAATLQQQSWIERVFDFSGHLSGSHACAV